LILYSFIHVWLFSLLHPLLRVSCFSSTCSLSFHPFNIVSPPCVFFPYHVKHSSLNVSLNSNNPGICGQTHCSCNISWCDNEQQCVPLDYISNILGCYETFQHISSHNVFNPNLCDHIHYMRSSDHEKHFHTFALVSTLKVSLF
jgi:hypothetical protein